jgi:uncharacterized membrane protein
MLAFAPLSRGLRLGALLLAAMGVAFSLTKHERGRAGQLYVDMASRMKRMLALVLAFLAGPAMSQSFERTAGIIGILPLPEVFGIEPCARFEPTDILIFRSPAAGRPFGRIYVAKQWTYVEGQPDLPAEGRSDPAAHEARRSRSATSSGHSHRGRSTGKVAGVQACLWHALGTGRIIERQPLHTRKTPSGFGLRLASVSRRQGSAFGVVLVTRLLAVVTTDNAIEPTLGFA